jgi:RimJ/RimL family protein N-acetyltransferase
MDETSSAASVTLRPVREEDLDALFRQMSDPESVRMAAFTSEHPDDRQQFDIHMARVRATPEAVLLAVVRDGEVVGSIGHFVAEGRTEVTYWIDRTLWGRGIATQALRLLLDQMETRPVYARAASDNAASLRVLEKAGFRAVGTEVSYAAGRRAEVEETILELR